MIPSIPASPEGASAPRPVPASPLNDRLCHLFRASLKQGRIHPLYLPILKYRQARAGTDG